MPFIIQIQQRVKTISIKQGEKIFFKKKDQCDLSAQNLKQQSNLSIILVIKPIYVSIFRSISILQYLFMKEMQKHDCIKWKLSLIQKLTNQQKINIKSQVLNLNLKRLPNSELKFMLQLLTFHDEPTREKLMSGEKRIEDYLTKAKIGSRQYRNMRLFRLKIIVNALVYQIQQANINEITKITKWMISNTSGLEQLRFVLKIMFKINSLYQISITDAGKLIKKYNNLKENNCLMFLIGIIKLSSNATDQANSILQKIQFCNNKSSLQQLIKKTYPLQCALKLLLQRQKQLLRKRININNDNKQRSTDLTFKSFEHKKIIMNVLENDFKIYLSGNRKIDMDDIRKINQNNFPFASSIVQLYFQSNIDVLTQLRETTFFKFLTTAKHFAFQNSEFFSLKDSRDTSNGVTKCSLSKIKIKSSRENYIDLSQAKNNEIYMPICMKGNFFIKYNYHNSNNVKKFVQFTQEKLIWQTNQEFSKAGKERQLVNVIGIIYGKVTRRHILNDIPPLLCFSIILKNRTLDLAIDQSQSTTSLFQFVLGSSAIIKKLHEDLKRDNQQKINKEGDKKKKDQLRVEVRYHALKIQQMTWGKLLWKNLFASLTTKEQSFEKSCFHRKSKAIQMTSKKIENLIFNQ